MAWDGMAWGEMGLTGRGFEAPAGRILFFFDRLIYTSSRAEVAHLRPLARV